VHLGSSVPLLQRIGSDATLPAAVFCGYAGWSPGQLEREMQQASWIPGECWPGLLFDTPIEDTWKAALQRLHLTPEMIVSGVGVSA
jgi:putative transcriptional regulator